MENTLAHLEAGSFYHIYNHANGNEKLFIESENYFYFMKLYIRHIHPIANTYAYCLMPNHFHFLIQLKEEKYLTQNFSKDLSGCENLTGWNSKKFSNLFNAYTKAYNRRYNRSGKLFRVPFKRKKVDNEEYLSKLIHYIHYNPVQHGFVRDPRDWKYSSYNEILYKNEELISINEVLKWFGGIKPYQDFHRFKHQEENQT